MKTYNLDWMKIDRTTSNIWFYNGRNWVKQQNSEGKQVYYAWNIINRITL